MIDDTQRLYAAMDVIVAVMKAINSDGPEAGIDQAAQTYRDRPVLAQMEGGIDGLINEYTEQLAQHLLIEIRLMMILRNHVGNVTREMLAEVWAPADADADDLTN